MRIHLVAIFLGCNLFGQEFEVASVRPANEADLKSGIAMTAAPGGRLTITNFPLKLLIRVAYGVKGHQISGGPAWLETDRFVIVAKPPDSSAASRFDPPTRKTPPPAEELKMLQALLADRFQLKLHHESKDGIVYKLLAGKQSKLNPPSNPDERPLIYSRL